MRSLAAVITAFALSLGLSACGTDQADPIIVEQQEPPAAEAPDLPDCDADDWRKKEVPDCGFKHQGKFYPWSWAKAGRKTAPLGWSASREKAATIKAATTRRS